MAGEPRAPQYTRDINNNVKTLSATDVLAPTTMKNAAKCDTSCELRNPVSHQNFERTLHFLWEYVCWSVCSSPQARIASCAGRCSLGINLRAKHRAEMDEGFRAVTACNPSRTHDLASPVSLHSRKRRDDTTSVGGCPRAARTTSRVTNVSACFFCAQRLWDSKSAGSIRSDLQSVKNTR